jgi:hypothetical protein
LDYAYEREDDGFMRCGIPKKSRELFPALRELHNGTGMEMERMGNGQWKYEERLALGVSMMGAFLGCFYFFRGLLVLPAFAVAYFAFACRWSIVGW